jgi:hypothetical protein
MGGKGSGRTPSVKTIIARQREVRTPIASDMFIPNLSGDHSSGIVRTTPTDNLDIPNKAYVDSNNLWEVDGTETQLKVADDIDMRAGALLNTGSIIPNTTQTSSLGSTTKYFNAEYCNTIYYNANAYLSGVITDGEIDINAVIDCSTYSAWGNDSTPDSARVMKVCDVHTGTTSSTGVYVNFQKNPSGNTTNEHYGMGGYTTVYAQTTRWNNGCVVGGLQFGPYVLSATVGQDQDMIGIETWGSRGYQGVVTADDIYGFKVASVGTDWGGSITADNAYGIMIKDYIASDPTTTITNQYQLYIEAPNQATNKYQVYLAGTGTGTGIYFNGTAVRIYSSAANTFDITCTTLQINGSAGATGSFTTTDGKTVTVTKGIVTSIV